MLSNAAQNLNAKLANKYEAPCTLTKVLFLAVYLRLVIAGKI